MAKGVFIVPKKESIYKTTKVTCTCGETFEVQSTNDTISLEVCSKCHPFYTNKSTMQSKTGKAERFNQKYGFSSKNKAA